MWIMGCGKPTFFLITFSLSTSCLLPSAGRFWGAKMLKSDVF